MFDTSSTSITNSPPIKLWKDYYICKKPRCFGCIEQGIGENEYKFCSQEKQPMTVLDEWGKKQIAVFENVYACQVYHWTIYQGQKNKNNKPKSISE